MLMAKSGWLGTRCSLQVFSTLLDSFKYVPNKALEKEHLILVCVVYNQSFEGSSHHRYHSCDKPEFKSQFQSLI